MSNFIDRLRSSKAKHTAELSETGKADGYAWARDHAEFADLVALGDLESDDFDGLDKSAVLEVIKSSLPHGDEMSKAEFMEVMFGVSSFPHQKAYAVSFLQGVQQFYREVAHQL